ncbi:unnamed protein product, partial [Brassica rapa subsp. narinosa]
SSHLLNSRRGYPPPPEPPPSPYSPLGWLTVKEGGPCTKISEASQFPFHISSVYLFSSSPAHFHVHVQAAS